MENKSYTHAECIGQWDREIDTDPSLIIRRTILPLPEDNKDYSKYIGRWEEDVQD